MYTLIVENQYGEQLELTHNSHYNITDIDGLDPPDGVINTTRNANADGSVFNSAYVDNRTITITMSVNAPAEVNRIALYQYFKSKRPVKLRYRNGTRDVYISGYVKSMQIAYFEMKQVVQIVVFCPEPYFKNTESVEQSFSNIESLFEFAFSIPEEGVAFSNIDIDAERSVINYGDVETGAIIELHAIGTVQVPKITNSNTLESMTISANMVDGDSIVINTNRGQKSVMKNNTTNLIGNLTQDSTWFQLIPGDNVFTISANEGVNNLVVTFTVDSLFEGV